MLEKRIRTSVATDVSLKMGSKSSTVKHLATGSIFTGPRRWHLLTYFLNQILLSGQECRVCRSKFEAFVKVLRPIREFSFIWRRHHYRWRAWIFLFYLYTRHWGFFSVQHLLWQGASVYHGHLLTPVAECLAVELSLPLSKISKGSGIRTPTLHMRGERSYRLCHCILN